MTYIPLPLRPLAPAASYFRPQQDLPERVTLDNPAVWVMTDLARVPAVTIEPQAPIQTALKKMIQDGVRMLLVTDPERAVIGLITTTDLQGEKPMRFLKQVGGKHEDIQVQNIMTPHERLEVLLMREVQQARVGQIVATLLRAGRQHALVVDEANGHLIRGIFSSTQIARQLGQPLHTIDVARTFAEVEVALNS
jgi:CBS-domain-containing membrane protein